MAKKTRPSAALVINVDNRKKEDNGSGAFLWKRSGYPFGMKAGCFSLSCQMRGSATFIWMKSRQMNENRPTTNGRFNTTHRLNKKWQLVVHSPIHFLFFFQPKLSACFTLILVYLATISSGQRLVFVTWTVDSVFSYMTIAERKENFHEKRRHRIETMKLSAVSRNLWIKFRSARQYPPSYPNSTSVFALLCSPPGLLLENSARREGARSPSGSIDCVKNCWAVIYGPVQVLALEPEHELSYNSESV